MLTKVLGVGLCGVVINIVLRQHRPEIAMLSNVSCGLIIFILAIDGVKNIIDTFVEVYGGMHLNMDILSPILKVVGIGYITEWSSDLAEESGNKSVSSKIVFGGKIAICTIALPIIKKLVMAILSLI